MSGSELDQVLALVKLLKLRVGVLRELTPSERGEALVSFREQHERAGLRAGLSPDDAREMAGRLEGWLMEALDCRRAGSPSIH